MTKLPWWSEKMDHLISNETKKLLPANNIDASNKSRQNRFRETEKANEISRR